MQKSIFSLVKSNLLPGPGGGLRKSGRNTENPTSKIY